MEIHLALHPMACTHSFTLSWRVGFVYGCFDDHPFGARPVGIRKRYLVALGNVFGCLIRKRTQWDVFTISVNGLARVLGNLIQVIRWGDDFDVWGGDGQSSVMVWHILFCLKV